MHGGDKYITKQARKSYMKQQIDELTKKINTSNLGAMGVFDNFEDTQSEQFRQLSDNIFGKYDTTSPLSRQEEGDSLFNKITSFFMSLFGSSSSRSAAEEADKRNRSSAQSFVNKPVEQIFGSFQTGTDYVPQTGLYQLHKGESVNTAAETMSGAPRQLDINLGDAISKLEQVGETIAEKIRSAAESVELKIQEIEPLKVEDKVVNVDTAGISSAISDALSSVKTDTGASVGADKIDALSDSIKDLNDKLITVKGDLDDRVTMIEEKTVSKDNVNEAVSNAVNDALNQVKNDINLNKADLDTLKTKVSSSEQQMKAELANNRRLTNEALNHATRPGL